MTTNVTLGSVLDDTAASRPEQPAIIAETGRLTFLQLSLLSTRFAEALIRAQILPGDRVLLRFDNSIELAIAYCGCFRAGVTAVPVPAGATSAELLDICEECRPTAAIDQYRHAAPDPGCITSVVPRSVKVYSALDPLATLDDVPRHAARGATMTLPSVGDDAPAVLLYTSGTTAAPKGVIHTHRSLLAWHARHRRGGEAVVAIGMPVVHSFGFSTLISTLIAGGTAILIGSGSTSRLLTAIAQHRAIVAIANPAMCSELLASVAEVSATCQSLRVLNVSGDVVPYELQVRLRDVFGRRVQRTYGATEMAPIAAELRGAVRPSTLGYPVGGVDVRIVDPDGQAVEGEDTGEILVRSDWLCAGYWSRERETETLVRDGWFHTGDLGHRTSDGLLWFDGRKKEIIVRHGLNVSPRQVEGVLLQHPTIMDAAVIGSADGASGEAVVAYVALRAHAVVDVADLIEFARRRLAPHKCPQQIHILEVLPRSATGKVLRRVLHDGARAMITN